MRTQLKAVLVLTGLMLAISRHCLAQAPAAQPTNAQPSVTAAEFKTVDAELSAVVKVFSQFTKRSFLMDERLKGKVSLYFPRDPSVEEMNLLLDSVLAFKGFTTVPIGKNLWKIVPAKEAIRSTIPTKSEDGEGTPSATVITRLIPLKYLNADEVKQLLTPLVSADGLLNAYTGTNSLIIIDSEDNIARIMGILKSIDLPSTDQEMTIVPIRHADAVGIAEKLQEILGDPSKGTSTSGDSSSGLDLLRTRIREGIAARAASSTNMTGSIPPGSAAPASSAAGAEGATITARSREPKIIPDDRTNSIIIVADEDMTARIKALVSQLDSEVDRSGRRFYVYRCQHSSAEELAEVLSSLMGEGSSSSGSSSSSSTGALGSTRNNDNSGLLRTSASDRNSRNTSAQARSEEQRRTLGRSRNEGAGQGGPTTANIGDEIAITADPATNSLIINASRSDYMKIRELLEQLDIKRRQVLVEAILLEVSLTDTETIGAEFSASTGGADGGIFTTSTNGDLASLLSNPTQLNNFTIAAASSGTLTLPGGVTIPSQTVLINAIRSNQNVNILSAPNILATDNEQAEIVVGQNVPFITSQSTSAENLNNTFNQVERQDVGITLRLTPQISSEDFVKLQIFTEVSSVVPSTASSNLGPTTTIRTSDTVIITKDSQMVVIGGLIADALSDTDTGVPYMKDIPVIGHLFKEENINREKRNLLIFIRPRIVRDQFDMRDATLDRRDRLEDIMDEGNIYPRREEYLHGDDLHKVSEVVRDEAKQPGTIRGSVSEIKSDSGNPHPAGPLDVPLELNVSPKVPARQEARGAASLPVPKAQFADASALRSDIYIVLEAAGKVKSPGALPFQIDTQRSLATIMLPRDSSATARQFFKVGQTYVYKVEDKDAKLVAVGIFNNAEEAATVYPHLGTSWYTLSPYEILNLGKGPWHSGTG